MRSSRMRRTARSLTTSRSIRGGYVSARGVHACWGVCMPGAYVPGGCITGGHAWDTHHPMDKTLDTRL